MNVSCNIKWFCVFLFIFPIKNEAGIFPFSYTLGIFGQDDRIGLEELMKSEFDSIAPLVQTTVAFFDQERIEFQKLDENNNGVYSLNVTLFNGPADPLEREKLIEEKSFILKDNSEYKLCDNEHFRLEPMAAFCTGVLVGVREVLTAKHCIKTIDICHRTSIVFGFHDANSHKKVEQSQIYKCVQMQNEQADLAEIITLDRPVPQEIAKPVSKFADNQVVLGTEVAALGNSFGLATKLTTNAKVTQILDRNTFYTNLDVLSGNSGSVVFNQKTKKPLGIVISSMNYVLNSDIESPYEFDLERKCFKIRHFDEAEILTGTKVFRMKHNLE